MLKMQKSIFKNPTSSTKMYFSNPTCVILLIDTLKPMDIMWLAKSFHISLYLAGMGFFQGNLENLGSGKTSLLSTDAN